MQLANEVIPYFHSLAGWSRMLIRYCRPVSSRIGHDSESNRGVTLIGSGPVFTPSTQGDPMELKWLEDFLCLARTHSFSAAAEERNITQSAFSRRIKALEKWLGAPLIDRSTYPVTLTDAGLSFRLVAAEFQSKLDDIRENLQNLRRQEENTVIFTAQHSLSLAFFPSWLTTLERSFGCLHAQMIAENMATCIEVLTDGKSDFLIGYYHPDAPIELDPLSFDYLKLDVDRLIPVSSPLSDGKPAFALPGDDDAAVPYLAYDSTSLLGRLMKVVLNRRSGSLHLVQSYEDAFAEAIKAMALDRRGLAWLPESIVRETIEAGKLVRAGSRDWDVPLEIRIYRSSERLKPTATDLWTFLQGMYTASATGSTLAAGVS